MLDERQPGQSQKDRREEHKVATCKLRCLTVGPPTRTGRKIIEMAGSEPVQLNIDKRRASETRARVKITPREKGRRILPFSRGSVDGTAMSGMDTNQMAHQQTKLECQVI